MQRGGPSFFKGLSAEELRQLLASLERRRFPAGTIVLAEGDSPRELYVIQDGTADVFVTDRRGVEHRINRVGPESTLGEMALFTAQAASATVRANTDLDVLVLGEADFHRAVAAFPRLYRNLGAILSERLVAANRHSLLNDAGHVILLLDFGSPPLLGYALACSMAWHSRGSTLLLFVTDDLPPAELAALTTARNSPRLLRRGEGSAVLTPPPAAASGAEILIVPPIDAFAPEALPGTVEDLRGRYDHVLVQVRAGSLRPALAARTIWLAGPGDSLLDSNGDASYAIRGWADHAERVGPDRQGILRVPAPGPADERALAAGALSATTATGRVLGWVARDLLGLKVGLVLGGGSIKGYAHIGVLRVFERIALPVDCLAGTSIGAAVASLRALGYGPDAAVDIMDRLGAAAFRIAVPIRAFLSSAKLAACMRAISGETRIEDLPVPLAVVTADIGTRKEVVFRDGLLWSAVLASMSLPGIFPAQRIGPYTLVDGGVINPVPTRVAAEMGADRLIAVKLSGRPAPANEDRPSWTPTVLDVVSRSFEIMQSYIATESASAATILIEPQFKGHSGYGLRRFSEGRHFIELGEAAAEAALPRIAAALPWLRGSQ